jgi:uncharacterized protein with GYD domain
MCDIPLNPIAMKTTYLSLLTFTEAGIRNLAQSPQRAAAWRERAEAGGVKVVAQLWTTGAHDGALLLEAENEQKILRSLAELVAQGNVRTHSLRAFTAQEFQALSRAS